MPRLSGRRIDAQQGRSYHRRRVGTGAFKLETRGLSKRYEIPVLDGLNLTVRPGEFLCLLGPSGCGKTTLLRILSGLELPDAGAILVDGEPVNLMARHQHKIGVVFQEPRLLPWRSVQDNITLCLRPAGETGRMAAGRAREYLDLVGLHGFDRYYPNQLSGGMQQRVSIARALSFDPALLLMDEPFGALDEMTRERLNMELLRIWEQSGSTIVFVTHSISEAVFLSTRVVVMSPRPGRITGVVDIDLAQPRGVETRENPRYSELIRSVRRLLRAQGADEADQALEEELIVAEEGL